MGQDAVCDWCHGPFRGVILEDFLLIGHYCCDECLDAARNCTAQPVETKP